MSNRPYGQFVVALSPQAGYVAPSGALVIAVGGTAQQLVAVEEIQNGLYVENPLTATDQGVGTAEALIVDPVGTTAAYPGTSVKLQPGDHVLFTNALTGTVFVSAASTGHKFSAFKF